MVDTLYYTVNEVAELWRCHPHTVLDMIKKQKLKAFKVGVKWLVSATALAECQRILEKEAHS